MCIRDSQYTWNSCLFGQLESVSMAVGLNKIFREDVYKRQAKGEEKTGSSR